MKKMKKIFFIAYGGGHIKMLLPIIKRLKSLDIYDIIVFGLTTAGSVLDDEGIPYVSFKDFVHFEGYESWSEHGHTLVGPYQESKLVSYDESIAYHGINFLDMIYLYGIDEAKKKYSDMGRQSFIPTRFFKILFSYLKPDLVVSTNSPRSERAAIEAAGVMGIDSLCLVDMFALQEVKWIGKPNYASKICVLNDSVKAMFIKNGRNGHDIIVTGNPAFDGLFSNDLINKRAELRAALGVEDYQCLILYASQPEPRKHPFNELEGNPLLPRDIEFQLRQIVKDHKNTHLVVRYHPSENVDFIKEEHVYLSEKSESLHELLYAVDVVVVTASTVGLEASLIGKHVISVDCSIFRNDAPFSSMGISSGIASVNELREYFNKYLYSFTDISDLCASRQLVSATDNVLSVLQKLLGD
ncbi:CDP-glycerol glycerophosphotransferase family protein [Aeromonas veronii]|uniref:UDP-N-acetylglucosamine 2-epimerase domain-containing protein n=2 Tax=Aeromonadaceae TaxID=84642 RepID=A0ABY3MG89_AERVE|nr:CDP-glycerol glycerophosphotransferase family protein [Aeromonas veronii]RDU78734.1 hypothetical protein CGZ72_21145 [Aeromonas veronii]RDU78822.1 hypothetical protein CGZ76_21470 [Aeromonas veronii]TEY45028.1 hypothetical protein CIG14_21190 [Aeromonas veronii]TEY69390.1 hypothetical protein CIG15_01755 [Aeromonas veronii]TEY71771.1 hypothetical protein CIG16_20810 [Aeromonas veronii]